MSALLAREDAAVAALQQDAGRAGHKRERVLINVDHIAAAITAQVRS